MEYLALRMVLLLGVVLVGATVLLGYGSSNFHSQLRATTSTSSAISTFSRDSSIPRSLQANPSDFDDDSTPTQEVLDDDDLGLIKIDDTVEAAFQSTNYSTSNNETTTNSTLPWTETDDQEWDVDSTNKITFNFISFNDTDDSSSNVESTVWDDDIGLDNMGSEGIDDDGMTEVDEIDIEGGSAPSNASWRFNETENYTSTVVNNTEEFATDDEIMEEYEDIVVEGNISSTNATVNTTSPWNATTDYESDNIILEEGDAVEEYIPWSNETNTTDFDDEEYMDEIEEDAVAPSSIPSRRPTLPPTLSPTATPTSSLTSAPTFESFGPFEYVGNDMEGYYAPYPLGVCQGDCDTDDDCAAGLYCFQRDAYDAIPGCTGGNRYSSSADFCVWNATSGVPRPELPNKYEFGNLSYIGNDGTFYDTYPLKVCRGDCDTDEDCAEGLFCFNRIAYQNIPGCAGGDTDGTTVDACIWNTSFPIPEPDPKPPAGAFRLKLYWQEGYMWQNETFEREWCMIYNYDGYPGTGACWYARELGNCTLDQVYTSLCIDGDPRQWFTFVRLGTTYSDVDEVLIQTVGESTPRCFRRSGSGIVLDDSCDPTDRSQRFYAINGGFDDFRFELGQYQGYTRENCVTNAHHPKSGELIEFHVCEEARKPHDETSFWELF